MVPFKRRFLRGRLAALVASGLSAIVALSLWAPALQAQVRLGAQGVYQSELFGGTIGVGGRALLNLGFLKPGVALLGTYDVLFPDCNECSSQEATASLTLSQGPGVYIGAGATYKTFDRGTDFGDLPKTEDWQAHFLLGLRFPGVPVLTPFGEIRYEVGGGAANQIVFSLGTYLGGTRRP